MLRPHMSLVTPFLNPQLASLPVYVPGRPIEEVAREHGLDPTQVIKLASNENPLGPSPKALAAMQLALKNLHLYPDGNAFYFKRRLAEVLEVSTGQLVLGNGSNEILELVAHVFMDADSEVVVSEHCFAVYPIVTALFGARLVTVPAKDFAADIPAMIQAVTSKTRVLFLANPNNPTGSLVPRDQIARLLAEVPSNVLIVMDEAYVEFLDDPVDLLPLVREGTHPHILLVRTFSKVFGLAGLRLGYGIGSPTIAGALEKVRQPFNINAIAQAGALAAIDDNEHLAATRANNRLGLEYFERAFTQMGLRFVKSWGNFVLVQVGDGARVSGELQKNGVIVRPMGGYRLPEWIRISVGKPEENARCVATLRTILGKI
ncbi:MAG TPA: histidinol-phosphate transaminase [Candidatus Limnocylindria bacterium]|jgi:histidinol-phosphate aminotransferase|nr:histidinol-phosphate transaminase [Candidatus Limnocylindria bacterium]